MTTATKTLEIIRARTREELRDQVTPEALLSDLGLCPVTVELSLPMELEEALDLPDFSDVAVARWHSVADVLADVERAWGKGRADA